LKGYRFAGWNLAISEDQFLKLKETRIITFSPDILFKEQSSLVCEDLDSLILSFKLFKERLSSTNQFLQLLDELKNW
jgi:hypothetical protein